MKNMVVEVYRGRDLKKGFLAKTIEEAISFLQSMIEDEQFIQGVVDSLVEQRQNPDMFPNVVIFLDENNQLSNIDQFMQKWNEKK